GSITGGDSVTINGSGFNESTEVYFGDSLAETSFIDSTSLSATVPPAVANGAVDIRVVNGSQEAILSDGFIYTGGQTVWTGEESSDWFDSGNWDVGAVPGLQDDVIINGGANQPILDVSAGSVAVNSLTLGDSDQSTLTLSNGSQNNRLIV